MSCLLVCGTELNQNNHFVEGGVGVKRTQKKMGRRENMIYLMKYWKQDMVDVEKL